jgi:hypothetical protein
MTGNHDTLVRLQSKPRFVLITLDNSLIYFDYCKGPFTIALRYSDIAYHIAKLNAAKKSNFLRFNRNISV